MAGELSTWQDIRDEVRRRVHARIWAPGDAIPKEADLAEDFGCARATVNRALRDLAEDGLLERRRKAGTRVALHPISRATLRIPIVRAEVEARGQDYGYDLLGCGKAVPPANIRERMKLQAAEALHVTSVHFAGGEPLMAEDRWICCDVVPDAADEGFETVSANEWLMAHAPFTHGDITFSSVLADEARAEMLGIAEGAPLFAIERTTWDGPRAVTTVTQLFAPGYQMKTSI